MRSKLNVLWIDAVTCNGCTHSFLNYSNLKSLLQKINLLYHPLLPSNELHIQKSDLLVIEGAFRENYLRLGFPLNELLFKLIKKTKVVLALGTCASFGGIYGSGIVFNKDKKSKIKIDKKIINLPGCPPHPEWIAYVFNMLYENRDIEVDELFRPVEIFKFTSHSGCSRNEYFEWKIDAKDFGYKEGCLFYEQGCQGPFTHSSCNRILWNEVNSKPRAGTPCFGCTERTFPKQNLFKTDTFMGIPANIPLGVSKRAYLTLSGIAKSLKNERLEKRLIDCGREDENNSKDNK